MSDIPDDAIEAAAEALWDHHDHDMAGVGYDCQCGERLQDGWAIATARDAHCRHQARAALEAVSPFIREWV